MLPRLTLVLGGARSGKSELAERLVLNSGQPAVYLATAEVYDKEMRARIDLHLTRRGPLWRTIEAPLNVAEPLATATEQEVVLLDCATLWLSNHMLAGSDLAAETAALITSLRGCRAPVVVVSNEVGQGIVPENKLARDFRDAQGRLNQQIAAAADLAVLTVAGLPLVLKGQMPG